MCNVYELSRAILTRFVLDYAYVCKHGEPAYSDIFMSKAGLEAFAHSPLFGSMVGDSIDPDVFLKMIREGKVKPKAVSVK